MDNSDKGNVLFEILKINLVRKKIINHIPSFSDISNLVNVCKFLNYDLGKEKVERSLLSYHDFQNISISYDFKNDEAIGIAEFNNLEFRENNDYENLRNRSRTFFGETLHYDNCVLYNISLPTREVRKEDYASFNKKLTEALNLNCTTRKDVKNLKFEFRYYHNASYIILNALSHMKHENITRMSLPIGCFTCPPNKYSMIDGNIFNGFPNLTELSLTFSSSRSDYYDLVYHKDIFERFVQQFSTTKNPTIFFVSLGHNDAMRANKLNEIISIIRMYNVKAKIKIEIDCPRYEGQCQNCTGTIGFFLPIKEYITSAFSIISYQRQLLHNIKILKTFENLNELHLGFTLQNVISNFITSDNQKSRGFGLRKLNNLKNVKLAFALFDEHDSNFLNSFYPFFEIVCSMMPRSVEVLQLIRVPDINDATAKMITKYTPDVKLLMIQCLSYKESDGLYNFSKLECLISYNYCPKKIPKTLKLLALKYRKCPVGSDDLISTDNLIKSYYEKFTKRISDNGDVENRYILFNDVHYWHLYKCAIQKYFSY